MKIEKIIQKLEDELHENYDGIFRVILNELKTHQKEDENIVKTWKRRQMNLIKSWNRYIITTEIEDKRDSVELKELNQKLAKYEKFILDTFQFAKEIDEGNFTSIKSKGVLKNIFHEELKKVGLKELVLP